MYADDLLLPWFRGLIADLPGVRLFDAHTHLGANDPDGSRCSADALALVDGRAAVFSLMERDGYRAANDAVLAAADASEGPRAGALPGRGRSRREVAPAGRAVRPAPPGRGGRACARRGAQAAGDRALGPRDPPTCWLEPAKAAPPTRPPRRTHSRIRPSSMTDGYTHPTGLSVEHAQTYAARACDYGFRVGRGAFARACGQIVQNDSPPSTQRGLR